MRQEDKRYEEWLSGIRSGQPVLDHPEDLTSAIVKRKKRNFIIRSWVLGTVAAVWLCLLLGETFFPSFSDGAEKEYSAWQCTSFSLPENWKKMSLMEKGNYCSVRYIKHKQQKQKRMSEIMNKTD
mgnify:CR=1 FL=1